MSTIELFCLKVSLRNMMKNQNENVSVQFVFIVAEYSVKSYASTTIPETNGQLIQLMQQGFDITILKSINKPCVFCTKCNFWQLHRQHHPTYCSLVWMLPVAINSYQFLPLPFMILLCLSLVMALGILVLVFYCMLHMLCDSFNLPQGKSNKQNQNITQDTT